MLDKVLYKSFNPLPLPKQGEIEPSSRPMGRAYKFQSAPLTEARGDAACLVAIAEPWGFNPLPLPKQGEIQGMAVL